MADRSTDRTSPPLVLASRSPRRRRLLRTSPEFLPDPAPLWNLPSAQSYESTDSERSSTDS